MGGGGEPAVSKRPPRTHPAASFFDPNGSFFTPIAAVLEVLEGYAAEVEAAIGALHVTVRRRRRSS